MITREYTYKKAFELKEKSLKEKESARQLLLNAAYTSTPRLTEIDNSLSLIGASLAITALSGDSKKIEELKKQSELLSNEKSMLLKKFDVPEIEYDCTACNDTGYVSGKICDCIKRNAAKIMTEELSKEMPLTNCKFENFNLNYYPDKTENNKNPRRRMTAILKKCKEYVINFNPEKSENLLFFGKTGLGKTHLTMAIISSIIEKGYLAIYGSAENLFTMVENEKFSGDGKGTYEAMLNCDLLVIDDLGTEMSTAFTKSVLYNLVNTRILSHKPTIINTNLSIKEIQDKYSERVASRFIGNYDWQEFLGNDIRQQKLLNK